MLIYIYLAALIVGGVLLGASILLGGHDDADFDVDGDVDLDLDADADVEAEGGLDKEIEAGGHGDLSGVLFSFLSLRFWTFFLAFFGLTGLVLGGFDLVSSSWLALGLSLGMGLGTGLTAMTIIKRLQGDTTGRAVSSKDYIGKTARVVVPFEGEAGVGKVRVDIKGNTVDLLASGLEEDDYGSKDEVIIVEMDGSRARVARLSADGKKTRTGG